MELSKKRQQKILLLCNAGMVMLLACLVLFASPQPASADNRAREAGNAAVSNTVVAVNTANAFVTAFANIGLVLQILKCAVLLYRIRRANRLQKKYWGAGNISAFDDDANLLVLSNGDMAYEVDSVRMFSSMFVLLDIMFFAGFVAIYAATGRVLVAAVAACNAASSASLYRNFVTHYTWPIVMAELRAIMTHDRGNLPEAMWEA